MTSSTSPRTTVCLLNWKRPENISAVIQSVSSQVPRPDVFLWNNGSPINDRSVDWYVESSVNMRCWPRWFMARQARTELVCVLDDDIFFSDSGVLKDLADILLERGNQRTIVGPCGVTLRDGATYKDAHHVHPFRGTHADRPCDLVKGRCMLMWRSALVDVSFPDDLARDCDDDIVISSLLARRRKGQHISAASLGSRFTLLPEPHALKDEAQHWRRRTLCCNRFFDVDLPIDT